jgi:hypothetical protein
MGIWRINTILYEEYGSPADRRVRIETDIPFREEGPFEEIRRALARDDYAFVERELIGRVHTQRASVKGSQGERPTSADLDRVEAVIIAAFHGR